MSRPSWRFVLCLTFIVSTLGSTLAADPLPKVVDPRLKIELFAENPQIVTPTGIDIDPQGRVWAIESNTHFPPEGYQGHPTDRLLVLQDTNGDGRADEPTVFADGLKHSMSVAVRPLWYPITATKTDKGEAPAPMLSVYVATRREIVLLHDDNGDLKADRRVQLVHLETTGDYPHNGLAGISFDALGWMYFGFGENLGADYKIIGSDGKSLSGGNEGGNIYRCRLDGTQLTHWSTGFWNPHATCVDAFGRVFAVDNDPDSRPPCRLLHIIPGGDYGYRFRNGRKGLHPFTAWNGEIPGTLPMVAGTGEAPSGIVAYESDGFPADYRGNLLVGSWGDHRIDRFQLRAKGTSFTSLAQPIVMGNENFRPVGLAVAPDGSLYFTDWVLREYKLHSKGRIWRLSAIDRANAPVVTLQTVRSASTVDLYGHLSSPVGPVRRMAAYLLSRSDDGLDLLVSQIVDRSQSPQSRLEAFWACANVALQPQSPTKLLLALRSLVAVRSLTGGDSGGRAFGGPRGSSEEVGAAAQWLSSDTSLHRNPVLTNLLNVAPSSEFQFVPSSQSRPVSLARLAASINNAIRPDEIFPARSATESRFASPQPALSDPFVLSLTVDRAAKVGSLEQFRKWWEAWQTPVDAPTNRDGFQPAFQNFGGDPQRAGPAGSDERPGRFASASRQVQTLQAEQMRHARTALVLAARRRFPTETALLKTFLADSEPLVKRLAVQWIAELKLKDLRKDVEALLGSESLDSDLFLTTLAALEMLDGISPVEFDKTPASKYVLPLVMKDGPATVRKLALRLVSPADPALTPELFNQLLDSKDGDLRLEAIRTLQLSTLPTAPALLQSIVSSPQQPVVNQAEAVAGLALSTKTAAADSPLRKMLDTLVRGDNPTLRIEALRALRGTAINQPSPAIPQLAEKVKLTLVSNAAPADRELAEQLRMAWGEAQPALPLDLSVLNRPQQIRDWYGLAGVALGPEAFGGSPSYEERVRGRRGSTDSSMTAPDAAAGRRTFFHANSAGCAKCHTIDGRGGKVGPDLTNIARTMDRTKLAQSILEPSREMSPQFVAWTFELKSGMVLTGLILSEESEKLKIGTADGKVHDLALNDIETRTPQSVSLMPEKLIDQLTMQEFLDLLAFLETLK